MTTILNQYEPASPHVTGLIRFAWDDDRNDEGGRRQRPEFEVLTRVHADVPTGPGPARMQTHSVCEKLIARDAEDATRRYVPEVPLYFIGKKVADVLKADLRVYDDAGRLACVGDGCTAIQCGRQVACPGSEQCEYGKAHGCGLHMRLYANVDCPEADVDPYAVFEFQSSSPNSYRALKAKLLMFEALTDGNLSGLPVRLTAWEMSTAGSSYQPFACANVELQGTLREAQERMLANREELGLNTLPSFAGNATDDCPNIVSVQVSNGQPHREPPPMNNAPLMGAVVVAQHAAKAAVPDEPAGTVTLALAAVVSQESDVDVVSI